MDPRRLPPTRSAVLVATGHASTPYCAGLRRVMHGVRAGTDTEEDHGQRVDGFLEVASPTAVLTSHSAAWVLGARFAGPTEQVSVGYAQGSRQRRREEVVTRRLSKLAPVVQHSARARITAPAWTAVDLARGLDRPSQPLWRTVGEVDAVLRATGCGVSEVRALIADLAGLTGIATARRVITHASDGVDSFPETRVRLLIGDAGLPAPVVQCPVLGRGATPVARLDLGWPDLRCGVEYDGLVHQDPEQHAKDLRRHNLLRQLGWIVLRVDARQMRQPERVIDQIRRMLEAASQRAA